MLIFQHRVLHVTPILDVIKGEGYDYGQGVICGKEEERIHDVSSYVGKRKVDASEVKQNFVVPSDNTWQVSKAQRGRRPEIFKAPLLLVKKSISTSNYTARASYFNTDCIYTDSITGIHSENIDELRNIAGVLNSDFFSYYALMCMSSIGIEREQSHNIEKFAIPYIAGGIHNHVKRIEEINNQLQEALMAKRSDLMSQREKEKKAIENCIDKELHLTAVEKTLLDYVYTYTIPMATGKKRVESLSNNRKGFEILSAYADVFLNRFRGQFGKDTVLNFTCEMSSTHVMLRFVVSLREQEPMFNHSEWSALERFLLELSTENISENLYLRKDIRGFERDGFYIIKPAEQRLWHPAVAYVDIQEFVDAILEQGVK